MQAIPNDRFGSGLATLADLPARARGRALLAVVLGRICAFAGALRIAAIPAPAAAQGHPELQANARAALTRASYLARSPRSS